MSDAGPALARPANGKGLAVSDFGTDSEVKEHLDRHARMKSERAQKESLWRDIDERVDPQTEGGFYKGTRSRAGLDNFDQTAVIGLKRYTAAIMGLTVPRNQRWHGIQTPNKDLNRLASVQRWCEHAADQLFACRYASWTGFGMQMAADVRGGGKYGTAVLLVDEWIGRGLYYRHLHMAECYIDEDHRGRVDTVHREYELTVRQAVQKFGLDALTDKMRECWADDNRAKQDQKFQFVHIVRPNDRHEPGNPGVPGKPIASLHIALDEKQIVARRGYRTMPLITGRVDVGAKYPQSPAATVIGSIATANEIAKTMLRTTHKACDPALAFYDDGDISKLVTRPGGMNPGLVDEFGRLLIAPVPGGGAPAYAMEMQERERAVIKSAFLEELFQILTNPSDRMTATQVLEMVQKQGVLVGPFAEQHETEKLGPQIERELDILMAAGQIDPMPPEMIEARMTPIAVYQNPLARMSRAEEAAGFTRWMEIIVQAASVDKSVTDHINFDRAIPGVADVLSVRPSWRNSPDEVAAKRQAREEADAMAQMGGVAPAVAGAALDLSRANQIASGAGV
ncbi:portal protein [Sphingomonas sanguinis]|uniref:portal protein n=1 Tax=Sphingomonas sanguinis TaxID=33051 RepID=UPI00077BDA8A|nr:portal protein [Sphingomonas sanguinis]